MCGYMLFYMSAPHYTHTSSPPPPPPPPGLYGYNTVPLTTVLSQARGRYVELLLNSTASAANLSVMRDAVQPVVLSDMAAYTRAVEDMGLPQCMEGLRGERVGEQPVLPVRMPYSPMIPELVVLAHRCVCV